MRTAAAGALDDAFADAKPKKERVPLPPTPVPLTAVAASAGVLGPAGPCGVSPPRASHSAKPNPARLMRTMLLARIDVYRWSASQTWMSPMPLSELSACSTGCRFQIVLPSVENRRMFPVQSPPSPPEIFAVKFVLVGSF